MNKKIILTIALGFIILASASVFAIITLENGTKLLEKGELAEVTNNQIANYMENNLDMTRYRVLDTKIIVYYNITYVEPTNGMYRIFIQEKPFKIPIELWQECLGQASKATCKTILADREEPFEYDPGEIDEITNETMTRTIYSTYYKAYQEQMRQFERAKTFRDKAIYNEMEELGELL